MLRLSSTLPQMLLRYAMAPRAGPVMDLNCKSLHPDPGRSCVDGQRDLVGAAASGPLLEALFAGVDF